MKRLFSKQSEQLGTTDVLAHWRDSDLLAVAGSKRRVTIYDRAGTALADINLPDPDVEYDERLNSVVALEWHPSGEYLAVLPRGQTFAMVWNATKHEVARVDADVKGSEACFLAWRLSEPQLLLGTVKGGGVVYHCTSRQLMPLGGRLGRAICSGAWVEGAGAVDPGAGVAGSEPKAHSSAAVADTVSVGSGLIVLGSKDQQVVWFDAASGTLLRLTPLRGVPSEIRVYVPSNSSSSSTGASSRGGSSRGSSAGSGGGSGRSSWAEGQRKPAALVSACVGRRVLLVWQLPLAVLPGAAPPLELTFQERYGDLEAHLWLDGGCLLAGFRSGQVAIVNVGPGSSACVRPGHSGTEVYSSRLLPYPVASLSFCRASQQVALGGGSAVGILAWEGPGRGAREVESDWAELDGGQQVAQVQWSPDGQLLTVATKNGKLHQYLVRAPSIYAVSGTRVAYTTSLTDVTVVDLKSQQLPAAVRLRLEPEQLALGPTHLAAVSGSKVAFHWLRPGEDSLLPAPTIVEFPVNILSCHVNATHAVLLGQGGQVYVQRLPLDSAAASLVELRGDDGQSYEAANIALTEHSIVVGLLDGTLALYHCPDLSFVSEYRHTGGGIECMYPDPAGTRLVLQDRHGGVFLYSLNSGELMQPPGFEGKLVAAVWHADDPNLLVLASDEGTLFSYVYIPSSVAGQGLKLLGRQAKPHGALPLVLHKGRLTCRLPAGSHEDVQLAAFTALEQTAPLPAGAAPAAWRERCQQALAICRFAEALQAAQRCGDAALLREVALTGLNLLEVPTAVAAYKAAGDGEAAAQLEPLLSLEDRAELAGRVAAILGDADRAQELLLASQRPLAALEMRQQLGHWEQAHQLAQELDPEQAGHICMAWAEALEAEEQFEAAAVRYQQALACGAIAAGDEALACQAGLARCSVQAGDAETGVELALQINDPALSSQCAAWLEGQQQAKAAARLYAAAGQFDRAAELYLGCREFAAVDGIITQTSSPAVKLRYAEAKEDLGSFAESAAAYQQAGHPLQAVRVLLQRLGDVQAALQAAGGSTEGALLVAEHCAASRQFRQAVQSYCSAGQWDAAFSVAQQQGEMQELCAQVRARGEAQQALRLAGHFEGQGELALAAEFAGAAGQYERAARLYLQAGGDSVQRAIALAASAPNSKAVGVVVSHLQAMEGMEERLVELHLAVGQPQQACAVALARAQAEQASGNYKVARDWLLRCCAALQERRAAATPELLQALTLLHSYLLVKVLVKLGDHLGAARLLLRVADSISSFPKHVVPILTSTVIECHRAELHASAYKWAAVLAQPQHLGQVAEPYRKKIESLARTPAWEVNEPKAALAECLFCGAAGPETQLICGHCSAALPFCLATGMRVTLADASECPCCHFPCRGTALSGVVGRERVCPLCEREVAVHSVRKNFDPQSHLRRSVFSGLVPGRTKR